MTETKLEFKYEIKKSENKLPVIIVAAGSSSRMQGVNKQLAEIGGIPVIAATLLKFEQCDIISRIILVTRTEDIFSMQLLGKKYGISKLSDIVCGGNSRQQSVLKGFNRVAEDEKAVLIHDGARPLVDNEIIVSVADALSHHKAVCCAVKIKDTVKEIDSSGRVKKTLARENLVSVQTPQGVIKEDYLAAVKAVGDVSGYTDDMSVMEAAGYEVYTTNGSYRNIKITTREDILVAEGLMNGVEE